MHTLQIGNGKLNDVVQERRKRSTGKDKVLHEANVRLPIEASMIEREYDV